jgi:hypothetical protein
MRRLDHWEGVHVHHPAGWEPGRPWSVVIDPSGEAFVDCIDCAERWPERVVLVGGPCFGWTTRPKAARCTRGRRK